MHKKYFLLLVLAITCTHVQAQVSLDSSEFPLVGTNYLMNNVAFIDFPPSAASGPGQFYDFTGGFTYGFQLVDYLDPTLGPFVAQYPTATLLRYALVDIGLGPVDQYSYYATDPSGYWQKGMARVGYVLNSTDIDTLFYYFNAPNEDTLLSNQYTYGYSDSTYSLMELLVWFGPTPVNFDNHIIKKIDADGWGTMETGFGSYDSVLRVHITEYKYDSLFINGNLDTVMLDTIDYYLYYQKGLRHPLVKEITVPYIDPMDSTLYYVTEILNIPPPPPVYLGCMDTAAINFNPMANTDDSSCVYCPAISYTITSDTYICTGGSTTLSATGGNSYLWSTGEMTATITVSPDSTTVYSVYINDLQFCWALATVEVDVFRDVTAGFWAGTITNGDSTVFVNLSSDAITYFWDFGDSTTSTEKNPTHLYSSLGTRTIRLIASNLCSVDTFETTINVVLNIADREKDQMAAFELFPNPGDEGSAISFELNDPSLITIRLIDILGKIRILENEREYRPGSYTIQLLSKDENVPGGIYFVELCINGNCYQKKWIKL